MTIILSAGLSQHVDHSFDDDDEDGSNGGRHVRHRGQEEEDEDEDELSEKSDRASKNLITNLKSSVGGIRAARDDIDNSRAAKGDTRLLLATGVASFAAGALVASGNWRDTKIASSIDPRITMALLLVTCGFVIMEKGHARKCRDGSSDVMSRESNETALLKQKHLEEYQRGRERILRALGSNHEFPLLPNDWTTDRPINADIVKSINEYANFAEASSELIQTIDKCLEVLRIGTGLHIGIGPASKSVCRVENTIVGREYREAKQMRENSQTSKPFQNLSTPLGLGRAREILHCVMADQFELLNSFLTSPCDDGLGWTGDAEDGQATFHSNAIAMSPLTLSSLVTWRKALGKLHSRVLEELCALKASDTRNLEATINNVRERNLYLQSCFPGSRTNSTEIPKENGLRHVQQRHLDNIYRRIDATLISIWAFENSMSTSNHLDNEQQDHWESKSAKKKWWLRTRDMLLEAIAYWHELDLHLSSTGTITYEEKEDHRSIQNDVDQHAEHQKGKNDGTFECASEELSSKTISNAISTHPTDKTIIFSGRASRRRLHDKKREKDNQEVGAPSSSSYRNNLFTELQSRIDMIELADEWDVHQEREGGSDAELDDDDHQEGANGDDETKAPMRKAMPLVLDSSSLFTELKESTIAVASGEDEVVLGD